MVGRVGANGKRWTAAAAIAAAAALPGAAHAGGRPSCAAQTKGMRLIALQPTAGGESRAPRPATRVVARSRRRSLGSVTVVETTYYGCAEPARRLARLARARSDNLRDPQTDDVVSWVSDVRIAGRHVAFVEGTVDQGTSEPEHGGPFELVGVVDLGARRPRRSTPSGPCGQVTGLYCGEVDGLALNERGAAAWVVTARPADTSLPPDRAVWLRDGGGLRSLDRGTGIDPGSIALGLRSVGWMNAGTQRFAPVA